VTRTIRIESRRTEIERAQDELRAIVQEGGYPLERAEEACLVAEEVLANVVLHGLGEGAEGSVELRVEPIEGGFRLRFVDPGPAFDPLAEPDPDLDLPLEDRPIGGLGIHLVRTLAEEVRYERRGDENVLTVDLAWSETDERRGRS
jgi:anti-sigma regulatory factor (Ser/Thr protein kinase)